MSIGLNDLINLDECWLISSYSKSLMSFTISCGTSVLHWKQKFQVLYLKNVHCCIVDITLSGCCELQHGGHNLQCIAYCNQIPCYFTACFAWHFLCGNLNSGALFQYKDHISRHRDIPSKNKIIMKTDHLCNGISILVKWQLLCWNPPPPSDHQFY